MLGPIPLGGGLVISLMGIIHIIETEATLDYREIGCGRMRLMVIYVIRTDPGTYAHLEQKNIQNRFPPGVGIPSPHNLKK